MPQAPRIILVGPPDAIISAVRLVWPLALQGRAHLLGGVTIGPLEAQLIRDPDARDTPALPNLGRLDDLPAIGAQANPDLAIVVIPEAFGIARKNALATLARMRIRVSTLPTPDDLLSGVAAVADGSPVPGRQPDTDSLASITEPRLDTTYLIGRPPRALDHGALARARRAIAGKRVLITGAGGSIGSELALAVAGFEPEQIILMERAENALFEIDRRLSERFPRLVRRSMLHDVVEEKSTRDWMARLRPHVVFHAAAHKHVTVMEDHPSHAINNNLFGARSIADASRDAGVERFVMISTDKAVNPRNVMGATKRFAEQYVRSLNSGQTRSRFTMVRFGNVLGSACSVLPIWAKQLAEGGPLTVTHPEMTRFFMTIPEAAQLVIQAGALDGAEANGADIFVLDMGEPVRIVELAERFCRAHGLTPRLINRPPAHGPRPGASGAPSSGGAMDIVFTGPRPGEKLHEELAHASEELRPTPAPGVLAWAGVASDGADVAELVRALEPARWLADQAAVLGLIRRFSPGVGGADAPGVTGASMEVKSLSDNSLTTIPTPGGLTAA